MRHRDAYNPPVWPRLPRAHRRDWGRAVRLALLLAVWAAAGAVFAAQANRLSDAERRLAAVERRRPERVWVTDNRPTAQTVRAMLPGLPRLEVRR